MIVDDLDIERRSFPPRKTDPPLVIDAKRMLAGSLALQRLHRLPGGARRSPTDCAWLKRRNCARRRQEMKALYGIAEKRKSTGSPDCELWIWRIISHDVRGGNEPEGSGAEGSIVRDVNFARFANYVSIYQNMC